jgi:kynureninase
MAANNAPTDRKHDLKGEAMAQREQLARPGRRHLARRTGWRQTKTFMLAALFAATTLVSAKQAAAQGLPLIRDREIERLLNDYAQPIFEAAGLYRLIEKSRRLTGYLEWLVRHRCADRVGIITPAGERGCQLSLVVRDPNVDARRLFDRLAELNVIGDWREPDVIRIAPAPLYNSYGDVFECVRRLQQALDDA